MYLTRIAEVPVTREPTTSKRRQAVSIHLRNAASQPDIAIQTCVSDTYARVSRALQRVLSLSTLILEQVLRLARTSHGLTDVETVQEEAINKQTGRQASKQANKQPLPRSLAELRQKAAQADPRITRAPEEK